MAWPDAVLRCNADCSAPVGGQRVSFIRSLVCHGVQSVAGSATKDVNSCPRGVQGSTALAWNSPLRDTAWWDVQVCVNVRSAQWEAAFGCIWKR
mmetsp:Transcript_106283/g.342877  ORF Transcript_106283/g.342877 Transcript_106283/m.342877 type:complete len:94 (+) Transcript_106283:28-309(+)